MLPLHAVHLLSTAYQQFIHMEFNQALPYCVLMLAEDHAKSKHKYVLFFRSFASCLDKAKVLFQFVIVVWIDPDTL